MTHCEDSFGGVNIKAERRRKRVRVDLRWKNASTMFPNASSGLSVAVSIPSGAAVATGGRMDVRRDRIDSLSHHLIAQQEKLFSPVLLLLQTTAEVLIYLGPLEYGALAQPTSSQQQQKLLSDPSTSSQLEELAASGRAIRKQDGL